MNLRTRLLNRLLDVASAEATLRCVHRLSARSAQVQGRLRSGALALVESCGVATRSDLAQISAELAALQQSIDALAQRLDERP